MSLRYVWCPDPGTELLIGGVSPGPSFYGRVWAVEADGVPFLGECCTAEICSPEAEIVPVDLPEPATGSIVILFCAIYIAAQLCTLLRKK